VYIIFKLKKWLNLKTKNMIKFKKNDKLKDKIMK